MGVPILKAFLSQCLTERPLRMADDVDVGNSIRGIPFIALLADFDKQPSSSHRLSLGFCTSYYCILRGAPKRSSRLGRTQFCSSAAHPNLSRTPGEEGSTILWRRFLDSRFRISEQPLAIRYSRCSGRRHRNGEFVTVLDAPSTSGRLFVKKTC
jgi:hypothetical protein